MSKDNMCDDCYQLTRAGFPEKLCDHHEIIRVSAQRDHYRRALETIRDQCSCDTPEVCYDVAKEALSRQGCTCSLAAAGHDKHCAMRTSDERKETPTERAERAYQMQQEMRKANARVREVIAKSSSKSNGANDGK